MLLRSPLAPWLARTLGLGLFIIAAIPDFFALGGWKLFGLLVCCYIAYEWFRSVVAGTVLDAYRTTFRQIGEVVSSLAGVHSGDGRPQLLQDPDAAIRTLLRRARELAETSLQPPAGTEITANLLLPEFDGQGRVTGLRVTQQDDFRPNRAHETIPLDAPGAGEAFSKGQPYGIADTEAEENPRVRGRTYKSVGAFPVVVGEPATTGRVFAVVSIDATVPYVFSRKAVQELHPFISPIAQLIGLALVTKTAGTSDGEH